MKHRTVKNLIVHLDRQHTYRHLHALCQNSVLFTISDYGDEWRDRDFERIVISDQQILRKRNQTGSRGAIIGTIRLLPCGDATTVMFVNKDAFWHEQITDAGEKLFAKFFELTHEHFASLGLLQSLSDQTDQEKLIIHYTRRLQKLKEKQALSGLNTSPEILIEIEDIEAEIKKLQGQLKQ